jgi:hypothetical protein
MCVPGDMIFARARALVYGTYKLENFESSFVYTRWLGFDEVYPRWAATDLDMILVVVIANLTFSNSLFNHFHVMMPDGRVARIFDDREHGYWFPIDELQRGAIRRSASTMTHSATGGCLGQFVINVTCEQHIAWTLRQRCGFNDRQFRVSRS